MLQNGEGQRGETKKVTMNKGGKKMRDEVRKNKGVETKGKRSQRMK